MFTITTLAFQLSGRLIALAEGGSNRFLTAMLNRARVIAWKRQMIPLSKAFSLSFIWIDMDFNVSLKLKSLLGISVFVRARARARVCVCVCVCV